MLVDFDQNVTSRNMLAGPCQTSAGRVGIPSDLHAGPAPSKKVNGDLRCNMFQVAPCAKKCIHILLHRPWNLALEMLKESVLAGTSHGLDIHALVRQNTLSCLSFKSTRGTHGNTGNMGKMGTGFGRHRATAQSPAELERCQGALGLLKCPWGPWGPWWRGPMGPSLGSPSGTDFTCRG